MLNRTGAVARGVVNRTEQAISEIVDAGVAAVVWPALIGMSGANVATQLSPSLNKTIHPQYGGLAIAALGILVIWISCAVAGRVSKPEANANPWAVGSRRVQLALLPLTLAPLAFAASARIEARHPFQVLGLAILGAISAGYYGWLLPYHPSAPETPQQARRRDRRSWAVVGLLVMAYASILSVLSILNHIAFQTSRADLGYYVSIFRRSSLGDLLGCTICGGFNHLSGHFDPILVLLSPLYWIYPEAETLLVLQSLLLGSAMVPMYLLARHHQLPRKTALLLLVVYGLHPALHGVNLFDFHSLALLIPTALWVWWAWETDHLKLFYGFVALMLLVREDAALVGIFISAWVALSKKPKALRTGLGLMVVCAIYFALVKGVLMTNKSGDDPIGQGYEHYYRGLVPKGTGTKGLVNSVLSRPDRVLAGALSEAKMQYWLQLLVPFAFLPLLAKQGKVVLVYGAAFTLLASREFVYSIHFHYSSVILPFLVTGTISALARLQEPDDILRLPSGGPPRLVRAASLATLVAAVMCSWKFGAMFDSRSFTAGLRAYDRTPSTSDWKAYRNLKQVCPLLPADASIAADAAILPHLGRCHDIRRKAKRWQADYLLWQDGKGKTTKEIATERNAKLWKPVESWGKLVLYKNTLPRAQRSPAKFDPNHIKPRSGQRPKAKAKAQRPRTGKANP